jgi:BTB/POZ domain
MSESSSSNQARKGTSKRKLEEAEAEARELIRRAAQDEREALELEMQKFEEEKAMVAAAHRLDQKIKLDVGGHIFTTTLTTLTRIQDSMLGAMFSGRHNLTKDEAGAYFIDRDGTHFRHILNFLRAPESFNRRVLTISEELSIRQEAAYYGLADVMFPKPSYKKDRVFSDELGNQVELFESEGAWSLKEVGSNTNRSNIIVCLTCKRGFCTPWSGNHLFLVEFDDGQRDISQQRKAHYCQACSVKIKVVSEE